MLLHWVLLWLLLIVLWMKHKMKHKLLMILLLLIIVLCSLLMICLLPVVELQFLPPVEHHHFGCNCWQYCSFSGCILKRMRLQTAAADDADAVYNVADAAGLCSVLCYRINPLNICLLFLSSTEGTTLGEHGAPASPYASLWIEACQLVSFGWRSPSHTLLSQHQNPNKSRNRGRIDHS